MGHSNYIVIAGMGSTGKSVAEYLAAAAVDFECCDAREDYPNCTASLLDRSDYIIKSPGIPTSQLPQTPAANIVNDIELFLRVCGKPVVMVTGTNGKSTVVALLEHILNACGVHAIACGNNGIPVMRAYQDGADVYILELSSYQLENISTLASLGSVVLNIGIDHVDRYLDIDEYEAVKKSIYDEATVSVLPIDEIGNTDFRGDIAGYVASGSESNVNYTLTDGGIYEDGNIYIDVSEVLLIGRHNHLNICAALCLLDIFELKTALIVSALKSFVGLPHRMELVVKDAAARSWINDSKSTNVHSLRAALLSQSRPVCLIVGGRGKGEDYAQVLSELSDKIVRLIAYGEDARLIYDQASLIEDRVIVNSVSEAVDMALDSKGDVLFSPACASFDQYVDFNARGDDFRRHAKRVTAC